MVAFRDILQRLWHIPPAYFVFFALLLTLWLVKPQLINLDVMGIFIRQVVPLGILVLGQLLVMRVRSIDLSGAGVLLVVNYAIASGIFAGAPLIFFIGLALMIGLAVGLFNGIMVGKRRASAVLVTLAVNMILIGIVEFISSGKPPGDIPEYFREIYNTKLLQIPLPVLFWIALTVLMARFLSKFVYGHHATSVGENPTAAHFSYVAVGRTVMIAHVIAGLMAAIAALVQSSSIAVGSLRLGLEMPIDSVAATILGGVVFGRGSGGVWGPFFGVLCFALLFVVMASFAISDVGKLIARGAIILFAAIFYGLRQS